MSSQHGRYREGKRIREQMKREQCNQALLSSSTTHYSLHLKPKPRVGPAQTRYAVCRGECNFYYIQRPKTSLNKS